MAESVRLAAGGDRMGDPLGTETETAHGAANHDPPDTAPVPLDAADGPGDRDAGRADPGNGDRPNGAGSDRGGATVDSRPSLVRSRRGRIALRIYPHLGVSAATAHEFVTGWERARMGG